jgi:hypothetical protein
VSVTFEPDDPEGNLDTADVEVTNSNGDTVGSRTDVDITGEEGQQVTVSINGGSPSNKPFTATVTVTDADGDTATDSGST